MLPDFALAEQASRFRAFTRSRSWGVIPAFIFASAWLSSLVLENVLPRIRCERFC